MGHPWLAQSTWWWWSRRMAASSPPPSTSASARWGSSRRRRRLWVLYSSYWWFIQKKWKYRLPKWKFSMTQQWIHESSHIWEELELNIYLKSSSEISCTKKCKDAPVVIASTANSASADLLVIWHKSEVETLNQSTFLVFLVKMLGCNSFLLPDKTKHQSLRL